MGEHLRERFLDIRNKTISICAPLKCEDYVAQPIDDVSPPKWHLAHTTWFFENFILVPYLPSYSVFNKQFNFIFNSYYESIGPRVIRTERGTLTRPVVEEILKYRAHVDRAIADLLSIQNISEKVFPLLELGLQHEQQHQELLVTDIKYILGNNPLFPAYHSRKSPAFSPEFLKDHYLTFSEGIYEIGYRGNDFCFDNELGNHKVFLHAFQIHNRPVSNVEFIEFIEAEGYSNFEYWLSEGWAYVLSEKIKMPLYWHKTEDGWYHYTLAGFEKLNLNEPVTHISFYEADAFARWKGKRLPTEFEWEAACREIKKDGLTKEENFLESGVLHPFYSKNNEGQMMGNIWEWTNSAYLPYPFYKKDKGALGEYNGKFMINQMVLRGGSCATPEEHIRSTYRNFFQPDKRWQYSGIRLADTL